MTKHLLFSLFPVVTQENKHQKLQNTKWNTYSKILKAQKLRTLSISLLMLSCL